MDKPIGQITSIKSLQEVKEYLQKQSQLNLSILTDKNNSTLLHFSAFKNDLLRMKVFIKHFKQYTQRHYNTGFSGAGSTFNDKLRAWVNTPNKQGYVPLFYAGLHGNIPMIQFLQECGANMQYRTTKNQNILFMCVQHNRVKALISLIESKNNYNVNMTNSNGETILHQACSKGHTQIVSYLLTIGAEMQAANNDAQTPLILATKQSKKQVVKLLLIKGANRQAKNKTNQTALQIAQRNQRQDLVKILDNNYSNCDKIKIKCNKKIVYEPQKSSYAYALYFIFIFHLFFLPVNILSQFTTNQRYIKYIPFIFEGLYELIILGLYISLLAKPKKRRPQQLLNIDGNFCAQCKRKTNDKIFHCYICQRCIYRYDHHCPWINNCVGSHNIGRFTLFLILLIIGLCQVDFCSISLLLNLEYVNYRKQITVPDAVHVPLNVITIIFSSLLIIALLSLLFQQLRNLSSNSTGFERQRSHKLKSSMAIKKPQLLASQTSLNESINQDFDQDEVKVANKNCISNCWTMLSQNN